MDEESLYKNWIHTWIISVLKMVMFVSLGFVLALIQVAVVRIEDIKFPFKILDIVPDFFKMSSEITFAVLTINGIILGFATVSIFNVIEWSDNLLRNLEAFNDIEGIKIVRSAFSRYISSYIGWSFSTILLQLVIYAYSFMSNLFMAFLFFYNFLSLIIIYEGFRIILGIVLARININL